MKSAACMGLKHKAGKTQPADQGSSQLRETTLIYLVMNYFHENTNLYYTTVAIGGSVLQDEAGR